MEVKIDFQYEFFGDKSKPVILFLHGFMGSTDDWSEVIESLSSRYYCLVIDLPFHGKTVVHEGMADLTFEIVARSIISLIEELKITRCHLVGYSMGGRIAFYLAVFFPGYFNKIAIESASPGLKTETEREERIKQDQKLVEELSKYKYSEFLEKWYQQSIFSNLSNHSRYQTLLSSRMKNDTKLLVYSLKIMGVGNQPSVWNQISDIMIPTILIIGERDMKFRKIAVKIKNLNRYFQIALVKNAGHYVHFENSLQFSSCLKSFFK